MSLKLLQFVELEQTCVEYGSSNASCYYVLSSMKKFTVQVYVHYARLFLMGINVVLL